MKTFCRATLMAAAVALLLPLPARSEIKAGSVELTPFAGYNVFEDGQNLKDRPVFGGRIGYNFTSHIGVEGTVEFIHTRVDDHSKSGDKAGQYGRAMDVVDLTYYHLDAVYTFMPDGRFNPFIVAGFGGSHSRPDISDHDMAAINLGIGAKYWLTDRIALRGDLRDYILTELFQESYNNVAATVGITLAFGGSSALAPAPAAKSEPEPIVAARVEPPPPTPAPVVSISADPATIQKGQCSTLAWNSSDGTGIAIDQGIGAVSASGSKQVCPASATSYTITGSGPGGTRTASATVSVTVPPPPPPPPPAPVVQKVVILASGPKVEEKVKVAVVEPKVVILAFEDVHFDFDKSTLKPEAQLLLKRNIQVLKENPNARIRVAGYTSASGTEAYNQKLSERRAEAVRSYLVGEGVITSDRLTTIGYGEKHPAEHEAAPKDLYSDAAKANMRVLFEIIVK